MAVALGRARRIRQKGQLSGRGSWGPGSRTAAAVRLGESVFPYARYVRLMSDTKDDGSANSSPIIVSIGAPAGGMRVTTGDHRDDARRRERASSAKG
jgi:hypothetical protein